MSKLQLRTSDRDRDNTGTHISKLNLAKLSAKHHFHTEKSMKDTSKHAIHY